MNPKRILTISNIISVLRAAMAVPIIIFLNSGRMGWVTFFIVLAIFSDSVDGFLARRFNSITVLGKALDPVADKICILSIILYLMIKGRIPAHFLIIVGIRDFALALMHIYLINIKEIVSSANFMGKISVVLVSAVVVAHIYEFKQFTTELVSLTYAVLLVSFLQYFSSFIKNFGRAPERAHTKQGRTP